MPPTKRPSATVRRLHAEFARSLKREAGKAATMGPAHAQREPILAYGLSKDGWRSFYQEWGGQIAELRLTDRLALARLLVATHIEEQGHIANAVIRAGLDELTPAVFDDIDRLLDDFSSWSITDDFATGKAGITSVLLARYPRETMRLHRRWNRSSNLWKRRTSVITFTRATAASGKYIKETLALCSALQRDPEVLVRKGVGWALKDTIRAGSGAKKLVIALVKQMRRAGASSTITLYAIRDLKSSEREAILRVKAAG